MNRKGKKIAAGAGTGAGSGAVAGSVVPGWGTLIGGVVGAGLGAVGAGLSSSAEEEEAEKLRQAQAKRDRIAKEQAGRGIAFEGLNMLASQRAGARNNAASGIFKSTLLSAMGGR